MGMSRRSFLSRLAAGVGAALVAANTALGSPEPEVEIPDDAVSLGDIQDALHHLDIMDHDHRTVWTMTPAQLDDLMQTLPGPPPGPVDTLGGIPVYTTEALDPGVLLKTKQPPAFEPLHPPFGQVELGPLGLLESEPPGLTDDAKRLIEAVERRILEDSWPRKRVPPGSYPSHTLLNWDDP